MKIVDLDQLTEREACIKINNKEYEIKEPTLKQWATFQNLDLEKYRKNMIDLYKYILNELSPELPLDELTTTELITAGAVAFKILNGGIVELGKKIKPLQEIIVTTTNLKGQTTNLM